MEVGSAVTPSQIWRHERYKHQTAVGTTDRGMMFGFGAHRATRLTECGVVHWDRVCLSNSLQQRQHNRFEVHAL